MWGSAQMVPRNPWQGPQETGALGMFPAAGLWQASEVAMFFITIRQGPAAALSSWIETRGHWSQ